MSDFSPFSPFGYLATFWGRLRKFGGILRNWRPSQLVLPATLLLLGGLLWAGELPAPPTLRDEPVDEQAYFQAIYRHHNNLVVVTSNPDGSRQGRLGDLIAYSNGGSYKLCVCTSTGSGGTTWRCSANALTAP